MKFTIQRDQFVQSVQHVSKAISSRTTIPVLTGIKIEASYDGVTLTGSDSDISIESFIPKEIDDQELVTIEQEGSIVLNAKFFAEIVKKLPEDTLEIMVTDQFLTRLTSGDSVFNLNGLDPAEYPRLPEIEEDNVFKMPKDLLKSLIRQTAFAVSTAETRPILTGIHWAIDDGILTCTATDSHRLAMRHAKVETNSEELAFSNVVIPGKSLSELSKIIDDTDELIDIIVTDNQILFKSTNLLFFSRLLDGNYPATKNMIPNHSKTSVKLESKYLLAAIERGLLLSREGKNNVVNVKTIENKELEITSVTPEVGKVTEKVHTLDYSGEELRISFNGKNLIDALKVIESTEITIDFTGAMSPFVMKPADRDHMLHLFSPVRTY
ncbi:DNA polymerase III subunit beta [Salipaludibacillus agaradhaerens]|jgi:DNA polymerase-3 subunit beta|uniref:Beta sliding clamp n=1 Tax=Salipaludibacillus agaradhaerens TaxID=76935 RepID=A0A9Q4FZ74_SALAG|nr:DNA polymerase III subunit beta [Salipaludibacillus agaradhaerens]MCR6098475.1 DNA polymerase III subunit beta [Salipaludibacillus agaradhaerens]MCR6115895.1 DNA polymerase III subunit beta [Salipaludibacillus agaradhaerens]